MNFEQSALPKSITWGGAKLQRKPSALRALHKLCPVEKLNMKHHVGETFNESMY